MIKIVDDKLYDTEKAETITSCYEQQKDSTLCNYITLCKSPKGTYFLHLSKEKYAYYDGLDKKFVTADDILVISRDDAIEWCKDHVLLDVLKAEFGIELEEG